MGGSTENEFSPWSLCSKQEVKIVISRKSNQNVHPLTYFNGIEVKTSNEHKHLGLILDTKLSFASHRNEKISKALKGLGIIKYLSGFSRVKHLIKYLKCTFDSILISVTWFTMYQVLPTHLIPQLTWIT